MDKLDPELMFELHPLGWDGIIPSFLREGPDFAARSQGVCVGGFSGQGPSEMPEKRTRMIRFVICKCGSRWRLLQPLVDNIPRETVRRPRTPIGRLCRPSENTEPWAGSQRSAQEMNVVPYRWET